MRPVLTMAKELRHKHGPPHPLSFIPFLLVQVSPAAGVGRTNAIHMQHSTTAVRAGKAGAQRYSFPTVKLTLVSDSATIIKPIALSSRNMHAFLFPKFEEFIEHHEEFHVLMLNKAMKVLGHAALFTGGIDSATIDIRIVMQAAILSNCCCLVLAHNHPSGALTPSAADRNITKRISQACKLMDIALIDHIILAPDGSYYSFADQAEVSLQP